MSEDIVADIKARVRAENYDFTTAEQRAAFDRALRAEIAKIRDNDVRGHAGNMLKVWRISLFKTWQIPAEVDHLIKRAYEAVDEIERMHRNESNPQKYSRDLLKAIEGVAGLANGR